MFIQPLGDSFNEVTLFPADTFALVPQECLEDSISQLTSPEELGATYLKLFNNKLCNFRFRRNYHQKFSSTNLGQFSTLIHTPYFCFINPNFLLFAFSSD